MDLQFVSLRWQFVALLVVVFSVLAFGVSGLTYLQEARMLQEARQKAHRASLSNLDARVAELEQSLVRRLQYLSILISPDERAISPGEMAVRLEQQFSNIQMLWGFDALEMQDGRGHPRVSRGTPLDALTAHTRRAMAEERPVAGISCASGCQVVAAIPVLLRGNEVGAIGMASSLAEVVSSSHDSSGWDTGILVRSGDSHGTSLPGWDVRLVALSRAAERLSVLQALAQQESWRGAGSYHFAVDGRELEISLTPLAGLDAAGDPFWVLIEDVTDAYASIRTTFLTQLGLSLGALLLSSMALVLLLRVPLNRLTRVAETLPAIAKRDFDYVRNRLTRRGRLPVASDELGALASSTLELASELERLDLEMSARNRKLRRSYRELSRQRDFVSGLLDHAQAVILVQNMRGRCRGLNRFGRELLTCSETFIQRRHFSELFGELDPVYAEQMEQLYKGKRSLVRHDSLLRDRDGRERVLSWIHSSLMLSGGRHNSILSIGMDVTEQMVVQKKLHWLANHDTLTQLPNRSRLIDMLHQRVADVLGDDSGRSLAILFCDLDNFKQINDILGHPVGDALLNEVSKRLKTLVRRQDVVARVGGDEFVLALDDLSAGGDAQQVAEKVLQRIEAPYHIQGQELFITVSIGIALCPQHGDDATTLIKHADLAMYQSKSRGRKQFAFYSPDQSEGMADRLSLSADLRHALQRQEFVLFYQPQLAINGRTVIGVEALIRWQHPRRGMVPPDEFISIAEETGLIVDIGRWVIREAARQLVKWDQAGLLPVRMAVNIAGQQLMDIGLIDDVTEIFDAVGADPERFEFEVTESFIMEHPEQAIARLHKLQSMGIQIAIDDFGTGYSSLSYLKQLPIDKLKIDKSFVFDIGQTEGDEAIARAVIALGRSLNLKVIAEGVEAAQHVSFMRDNGCDELQGFYFSKPLPAVACAQFIDAHRNDGVSTLRNGQVPVESDRSHLE